METTELKLWPASFILRYSYSPFSFYLTRANLCSSVTLTLYGDMMSECFYDDLTFRRI